MSTPGVFVALFSVLLLGSCSSPADKRAGQCHPCTVSARAGPLLKQAQQMIAAKNYQGAAAKLDEAEAVQFNPDDAKVIDQFRRAIKVEASPP
ncbi:MAG TPA: hypothetical protein VE986_04210 [Hyphomicrobiales bacterium]|nr:hypothetical protein [Hyphomicrobiales bacterium]